MLSILAKRTSLVVAALGVSVFAGPLLAAPAQSSSGQSGQSAPSSQSGQASQTGQSGQSDQSGAAQPGVMHTNQPTQPADGSTAKAADDKSASTKKTNGKQSKKDPKSAKSADTAKGRKSAKATNAKSKKAKNERSTKTAKADKTENKEASAEPDKVLYDRAMADIKKSRFTEGRLSLQTLINTYPDSEYLAKAKLAVADSYYKEGGTSNLTQSIQEYIDFQTFFPFLDEASYAQMQVGMAHYKMMEKSDRDSSQALGAEDAFQTFLLKYPTSPLASQAEQHLRDVQEVLADGEFKIAHFYYVKQDYRAAAARLVEVTDRYPLYSGSDEALWMLGNVYVRAKQASKNEDDKNHWADLAGKCYTRIVRDYPLSRYSGDAKGRLSSMGMPVPQADPNAVARMQKEQLYAKAHRESVIKKAPLAMLKSNPDVSGAAHSGAPNLNPPTDAVSATEVLKPGAAGPGFGLSVGASSGGSSVGEATSTETAAPAPGSNPGMSAGVQIISTGGAPATDSSAAAQPSSPAMEGQVLNPSNSASPANQPAAAPAAAPDATPANPAASSGGTAGAATPSGSAPAASSDSSGSSASGQASGQQQGSTSDSQQESSSKKKKGLKKLIPF